MNARLFLTAASVRCFLVLLGLTDSVYAYADHHDVSVEDGLRGFLNVLKKRHASRPSLQPQGGVAQQRQRQPQPVKVNPSRLLSLLRKQASDIHAGHAGRLSFDGSGRLRREEPSPQDPGRNASVNLTANDTSQAYRLDYMPGHNMVVCACAKCGSTSLYNFIYQKEFRRAWPYTGKPFVHQVTDFRWEKRFLGVHLPHLQDQIMTTAYSFALVRDPRERIMSAWRSKVACDDVQTGVDKHDRKIIVPELQRLAGHTPNVSCMSLDMFARTLFDVHKQGKQRLLNMHFLPQDEGCFSRIPASRWTAVATITDATAFRNLAEQMGDSELSDVRPPKNHRSARSGTVPNASPEAARLLQEVTRKEYEALTGHLPPRFNFVVAETTTIPPLVLPERRVAETPSGDVRLGYMPGNNVVICACAKCGSTSLYNFVYEKEFGKRWPYTGRPLVHQFRSFRWEHHFIGIKQEDKQEEKMQAAYSFALIRDPKQRLISAWKSKVACDQANTGVDVQDRAFIVPDLRRLQGKNPEGVSCLSLEEFIAALHTIHKAGKASHLNPHFLPQDSGCFAKFPPSRWSRIATITNDAAFQELGAHLLQEGKVLKPGRFKATSPRDPVVTPRAQWMLDEITRTEYSVLSGYVTQPPPQRTTLKMSERPGHFLAFGGDDIHPLDDTSATTPITATATTTTTTDNAAVGSGFRLNYVEDRGVLLCSCPTCGRLQMDQYLSEEMQMQEGWQKSTRTISSLDDLSEVFPKARSFALVRDPKHRLIEAWKSKVSCSSNVGSNSIQEQAQERANVVNELLRLDGRARNMSCLVFWDFVNTLYRIHMKGQEGKLSGDFLPQDMGCFKSYPTVEWTVVGDDSDPATWQQLSAMMGRAAPNRMDVMRRMNLHQHHAWDVPMSKTIEDRLIAVTAREYEELRYYLAPVEYPHTTQQRPLAIATTTTIAPVFHKEPVTDDKKEPDELQRAIRALQNGEYAHRFQMHYMPRHNMVICSCAKCGSTSLYKFIYQQEFGEAWPHHGHPFVQQTTSERWHGAFVDVPEGQQEEVMARAFSYALVRDPKERLISAWKSKVACDYAKTGVDKNDRAFIVPQLRRLQGRSPNVKCMSFKDFIFALSRIHNAGKAHLLNPHFLPQTHECFNRFPTTSWSKVVSISEPHAFRSLGKQLGVLDAQDPPHNHHSPQSKEMAIRPTVAEMLSKLTASEYAMLDGLRQNQSMP